MPGIGIITNPHAKLNKQNPQRQELLSYIAGKAGKIKKTNTIRALRSAAAEFRDQSIDILAISGGDGTISKTLSTFIHTYQDKPLPSIAILGGGTINTLAENLSIKGPPEKNLYRLLELHASTQPPPVISRQCLKVENNYGFLFADGLCVQFLKTFYKKKTNALGATALVIKLLWSQLFSTSLFEKIVTQEFVSISSKKEIEVAHNTCNTLCSTIKNMPLGIPFFLGIDVNKAFFECISITCKPRNLSWKYLPKALIYSTSHKKEHLHFCSKKLTLTKEKPFFYTLDGELYETTSKILNIALGPKLTFILINQK